MVNWNLQNRHVLLVDGDSTIPNLALMKMASWFKQHGNVVDFMKLRIPYYPNQRGKTQTVDTTGYDLALCSVIFEGAHNFITGDRLHFGGTGYDITSTAPAIVMNSESDYSLYPDNDTSYGFLSRGCTRKCYFCVVPQKEGLTKVDETLDQIIKHRKVKFLDNNILSLDNHEELLAELVARQTRCQFMQGLDIRYVTPANSALLRDLNYMQEYIFAFDDWKYRNEMARRIKLLSWRKPWKLKFYVYVAPHMKLSEHTNRINWLRDHECLPYIMRDQACWGSEYQDFYTDLAAWCNQPALFKNLDFYTFLARRHKTTKDPQRETTSANLYKRATANEL